MRKEEKKILIVDDSAMVRKLISHELSQGGYQIDEAETGIEAIVKCGRGTPPDLITMDIEMPGLSGIETSQKLRNKPYRCLFTNYKDNLVPIIMVTSLDTSEIRQKGFKVGATDFITKPFAKHEILDTVNRILKPEKRLAGFKALVVDDSRVTRLIVSEKLRREGVEVLEAENGLQGFELLCNRIGAIDLVITDYLMPELNGLEFCTKIRSELGLKDLPVIFLTSLTDTDEVIKIFKAGASDYLVKPFVGEELLARLRNQLYRVKSKNRLKDTINELHNLNQMKDDLIAVCSHDLRSPLTGILGFTELLQEKDYFSEEDQENLAQIKSSGEFLLSLVNDILDLSKSKSESADLEMEIIDLSEIVKISINAIKHLALAKEQELKYINDCLGDDKINGNQNAMIRVVNNLLSNAVKFTPEKGVITVTQKNLRKSGSSSLLLQVSDSGIGIAEEKIPFLFDKFSKTSRSGTSGEKGTGLGMSIVREVLEKHDSRVEVRSEEGKGTCFDIYMPAVTHKEVAGNKEKKHKSGELAECSSCTILLAEDNPVNVKLVSKILTKAGHDVRVAENGKIAVELVDEFIDLILMDMRMPELDGLGATKKIRNSGGKMPIIALTANSDQASIDTCLAAGMDDFLAKPFKPIDLKLKVAEWGKDRDDAKY
jgi:CheY-like chemotaxis protein/two-component sensor histidine kinase